jgi:hypothetical protein
MRSDKGSLPFVIKSIWALAMSGFCPVATDAHSSKVAPARAIGTGASGETQDLLKRLSNLAIDFSVVIW